MPDAQDAVRQDAVSGGPADDAECAPQSPPAVSPADRAPHGFATAAESAVGSVWSVLAGLAVFAAILASVWYYLYPRLSGEPLSSGARLEVRLAVRGQSDGWRAVTLPDGAEMAVAPDVLLTAADVGSFRGIYHQGGLPVLRLNLTSEAAARLEQSALRAEQALVVLVNEQPAGWLPASALQAHVLELELMGVSRADAEDIFARLTQ